MCQRITSLDCPTKRDSTGNEKQNSNKFVSTLAVTIITFLFITFGCDHLMQYGRSVAIMDN